MGARLVRGRELYRWVTRGESNCPVCARLDGEVRGLGEWQVTRMPGFHRRCDCRLEAVLNGQAAPAARPRPGGQIITQPKSAPRRENFRGQIAGSLSALKPVIKRVNKPKIGRQARINRLREQKVKKGIPRG
jgi:hypothetical protein